MQAHDQGAALILIDVQKGFGDTKWGRRNNPDAEQRMSEILVEWRRRGLPIIHIKHDSRSPQSPLSPGKPGNEIMDIVRPLPNEPVLKKNVNSAFIGTNLEAYLRAERIKDLVIVGLTTPHCVSTTVRMAGNLGFDVHLVGDATAAFELHAHDGTIIPPEEVHFHALAALSGEFAEIVTTEETLKRAARLTP
jgi:nicotinamidase-related amidase